MVAIVALTRHSLIFGTPTVMIVNAFNDIGWWKTLKKILSDTILIFMIKN